MAYHIYTTRGLVLSSWPLKEADRTYAIFTEELGLVRARATGVRRIQSKLRAGLEPFSFSVVSLVRGQEVWRLTGATLGHRIGPSELGKKAFTVCARVFSLLEKLVVGEETHKELFQVLSDALAFVEKVEEGSLEMFEILFVLRLLHELGYISDSDVPRGFLEEKLSEELLIQTETEKKNLLHAINHGLQQSNLV
jgi:DNA repair protein RecO